VGKSFVLSNTPVCMVFFFFLCGQMAIAFSFLRHIMSACLLSSCMTARARTPLSRD
jgi:hypothetical protein